jgi:hypothetical protein
MERRRTKIPLFWSYLNVSSTGRDAKVISPFQNVAADVRRRICPSEILNLKFEIQKSASLPRRLRGGVRFLNGLLYGGPEARRCKARPIGSV